MTDGITKIFIIDYPQATDEMGLAQLVRPYGEISTIKIAAIRSAASQRAMPSLK
jgi:hypothetical protein